MEIIGVDAIHATVPELTLMARLFQAIIIWRGGKTLCMEQLGLVYQHSFSSSETQRENANNEKAVLHKHEFVRTHNNSFLLIYARA